MPAVKTASCWYSYYRHHELTKAETRKGFDDEVILKHKPTWNEESISRVKAEDQKGREATWREVSRDSLVFNSHFTVGELG